MSINNSEILNRLQNARNKKEKRPPQPIAKVSAKKAKEIREDKNTLLIDKEFYAEIWLASPHVCQCGCKQKLGKEMLTTFFHHLLFKAKYPAFRWTPENIMLLHPDCHNAYHSNPDNRPEIKRRQLEAIKLLLP